VVPHDCNEFTIGDNRDRNMEFPMGYLKNCGDWRIICREMAPIDLSYRFALESAA